MVAALSLAQRICIAVAAHTGCILFSAGLPAAALDALNIFLQFGNALLHLGVRLWIVIFWLETAQPGALCSNARPMRPMLLKKLRRRMGAIIHYQAEFC